MIRGFGRIREKWEDWEDQEDCEDCEEDCEDEDWEGWDWKDCEYRGGWEDEEDDEEGQEDEQNWEDYKYQVSIALGSLRQCARPAGWLPGWLICRALPAWLACWLTALFGADAMAGSCLPGRVLISLTASSHPLLSNPK